jgi:NADH:ubiquinone oxidoreductase subunit F (NADH-binding)
MWKRFAWVPFIFLNGGKTYANQGVNGWKGRRYFSVSGDVKRPAFMKFRWASRCASSFVAITTARVLQATRSLKRSPHRGHLAAFCGSTNDKWRLTSRSCKERDLASAGRSTRFDPASSELNVLDLELELNLFRALSPTQALGAGLVVYADDRDMAEQAVNSVEFFRNESCGKCVPCRLGSQKLASLGSHLLNGEISSALWQEEILPLIKEMGKAIELASICGLGRSVPVPLMTVAAFFPRISQNICLEPVVLCRPNR